MTRTIRVWLLAFVALFLIEAVSAQLLLHSPAPPEGGSVALVVVALLLNALVFTGLGQNLAPRGLTRVGVLALLAAGIPVTNLLEAAFFSLDIPPAELRGLFIQAIVVGVLLALALEVLLGAAPAGAALRPEARSAGAWALRIGASILLYVVCYTVAGLLVWPFIRPFYEGRPMPDPRFIPLMQVFRGAIFTSMAFLVARFFVGSRGRAALAFGLTMSLFGGVIPLLLPNPYMPASIRYPHMVETGVSNLVFGILAVLILRGSGRPAEPRTEIAAA